MTEENKKKSEYPLETVLAAKALWLAKVPVADICRQLGINNRNVVYNWRDRFNWEAERLPESALVTTTRQFNRIMEQDKKTDADWSELNRLADILNKLEKGEAYKRGDSVGVGRPPGVKTGEGRKKKKARNDISDITPEMLQAVEDLVLYPHQKVWVKAGEDPLTSLIRFVLKSRQIGATYTFAWEALKTAILTGRNQLFISATRAQAEVFKAYITILAREQFGVELSGNPTRLSNGAELHYLSPNSNAQSRSGDVYFDEVFWTKAFNKMEEVAAPMATLDGCKITYFSTPSALSHPAYEIWSGERYTRHHQGVQVNVSNHKSLRNGQLGADGIWRCVCTINDAIEMGWDKTSVEKLRLKTPDPNRFRNIYECVFVDDTNSVFRLSEILACAVDTAEWKDFKRDALRPIGDVACSLGYDPAGTGDNSAVSIVTKPASVAEKFRLVRKEIMKGIKGPAQAARIEAFTDQYRIEDMEIDDTGVGITVGDFIEPIFPRVRRIRYNPEYKSRMVQKFQSILAAHRFEYDEEDKTLPLAFMTVKQETTKNGVITYASSHSEKVGHGDEAWSTMHACMCEPLNPDRRRAMTIDFY